MITDAYIFRKENKREVAASATGNQSADSGPMLVTAGEDEGGKLQVQSPIPVFPPACQRRSETHALSVGVHDSTDPS